MIIKLQISNICTDQTNHLTWIVSNHCGHAVLESSLRSQYTPTSLKQLADVFIDNIRLETIQKLYEIYSKNDANSIKGKWW